MRCAGSGGEEVTAAEHELTGGNASGAVVRVGDTVRKPWLETSTSVQRYMQFLAERGIDLPRPLGRDDRGRQSIQFVPGASAMDSLPLDTALIARVGAMVRQIHDASEDFPHSADDRWDPLFPAPAATLICHGDLAPWNLILGERPLFVDWDGAGPSTRLWDLGYAAQSFAMLNAGEPIEFAADRLRAFARGYEMSAELRQALPEAMAQRTAAMYDLLRSSHDSGRQPWGRMFLEFHGEFWRGAAEYVLEHRAVWAAALAST